MCLPFVDISRLKSNIIAEFTEPGFMLCVLHCVENHFCAAVNYKEKFEESKPNCQLTNTTEQIFDDNAGKADKVWTFHEVDVDRSQYVS